MNSKKQQKQKPDERQQKIVTILSQKGEVTREFLMKELGIKSRTLMYDLAALEKKGFVIKKSPGRPDGTLRLHKCNIYYEDMAKLTIRKWTILNILQRHKHPQNIDGIIKNYNSIIGESILCQDTIQATLDKMIQENLVIKEEENKENIYLPNHNSVVIGLKEDSLVDIFFDLSNYYQGSYYKNQLIALQKKFSSYWEQPDTSADWRPPYYTMSKHPSTISDIQNYLDKLLKYRFQTNILKFQYASSDNSDNNVNYSSFQTGKLIYSENKDKMYLLGKFKHDAKLILDIKRILFDTMEETPQKNTYYDRQEYQNMVNEMFDISTEEPESIQLQFKNNPVIYDKINRLKKNRKELATIDCNGSSIIYKDKIRGISDMANYLRQFGSDVQVLEPLKLRKKMQESAERTLNNYNTEKNKNLQWKPLESIVNSAPEFTDTGNSSALDRLYQILTILSYSTPKHTPKKLSELLNVPIEIIRNDLEIIKASDELALDSLDEDIDMSQVKKFDEKFDNTAFYIDMIGFLNTDIAGEEYNTFEESDNCMESDSLRSLYMALTKQEYQTLSRFVPKLNPPNQLPLYTIKAMNTLPFDSNTTRYLSKIDNAIRNKTTLQIRYQAQNARSSSTIYFIPVTYFHDIVENILYVLSIENKHVIPYRLDFIKHLDKSSSEKKEPPTQVESLLENLKYVWSIEDFQPESKPIPVKILIKNHSNVISKIQKETSEHDGTIFESNGYYLYEDKVIGMDAFRSWVLRYGSSITVLEPPELRADIISANEQTLKNHSD